MNLKVYLAVKNMTMREFAKKIGCHSNYLSRTLYGHTTMSRKLAKKIEDATEGEVRFRLDTHVPIVNEDCLLKSRSSRQISA